MTAARVHLMSPDTLPNDLLSVWRAHQAADDSLRGPFFSPEYVSIAAATRPEVTLAVIETPGQAPAFLPFHRDRSGAARAVGLRACDFSGLIAAPGYTWSPESVIRSCGLAGWDFSNVVSSDQTMRPHFRAFADSPFGDLDRMVHTSTDTFGGLLSVLYAGDQIAAVHMGMRSDTVWHYWFAAYNHDLQRYSPGLIILMEMIKAAPALGIRNMTLGQGDEAYKLRFATGSTQLASGSVDCRLTRRLTNAIGYAARTAAHRSPIVAALARSVKRGRRRMFQGAQ